MKLSVMERIMVIEILPPMGDFTTLKILRELKESLAPTESEVKRFGIEAKQNEDGTINYHWKQNTEVDIPMNERQAQIIRDQLQMMNDNKRLTEQHVPLYEKFVVAKEKADKVKK